MMDDTSNAPWDEVVPNRARGQSPAEFTDPVLEVFKRDIDFTLVERNLRLSTEDRARQLVNATRFVHRFRGALADGNP